MKAWQTWAYCYCCLPFSCTARFMHELLGWEHILYMHHCCAQRYISSKIHQRYWNSDWRCFLGSDNFMSILLVLCLQISYPKLLDSNFVTGNEVEPFVAQLLKAVIYFCISIAWVSDKISVCTRLWKLRKENLKKLAPGLCFWVMSLFQQKTVFTLS